MAKYFKSKTSGRYFDEDSLNKFLESQLFLLTIIGNYYIEDGSNKHNLKNTKQLSEKIRRFNSHLKDQDFEVPNLFQGEHFNVEFPTYLNRFGYFPDCPNNVGYAKVFDRDKSVEYQAYKKEAMDYQSALLSKQMEAIKKSYYTTVTEKEYKTALENDMRKAQVKAFIEYVQEKFKIKEGTAVDFTPQTVYSLSSPYLKSNKLPWTKEMKDSALSFIINEARLGIIRKEAIEYAKNI